MKIEFTVEEYFEQLKLMEEQYGLEEDLYPWIYMLLQMAESKKNGSNISIRDIHNWKKKHAPSTMEQNVRKAILNEISSQKMDETLNGGAPEFLIMDNQSKHFLGCVEIKKLNDLDWTPLKQGKCLELETEIFKIKCAVCPDKDKDKDIDKDSYKEAISKAFDEVGLKPKSVKYLRVYQRTYYFEVIVEKFDYKFLDSQIKTIKLPKGVEIKKCEQLPCHEEEQIKHHLRRFKKVLYTDGLEFYLLKQNSVNDEFDVKKVADLEKSYEHYKKTGNIEDCTHPNITRECREGWIKIQEGIDWCSKPWSEINKEKE